MGHEDSVRGGLGLPEDGREKGGGWGRGLKRRRHKRIRWRKRVEQKRIDILSRAADMVTPRLRSYRKRLAKVQTPAEIAFQVILRECELSKLFKPQAILFGYIIDFFSARLLLGIEIDGEYHEDPFQKEYDDRRERQLSKRGIKIIRFSNKEILFQGDIVKRVMLDKFGRFSKSKKIRSGRKAGVKIYFAEEQTQQQLRALVPSEMGKA